MEYDQEKIERVKRQVMAHAPVEQGVVDDVILQSWIRSRNCGLHPEQPAETLILPPSALQERIQEHRAFYDVAVPVMESLFEFTRGSGFLSAIADEEGYILRCIGDEAIMGQARRNGLTEGGNRSEQRIGTNGIGTALAARKPIQVIGSEHFQTPYDTWVCSGAPAYWPDGREAGVICIIGEREKVSYHTLGMAAAAASAITKQLQMQDAYDRLNTLQTSMKAIIETIQSGVMMLDRELRVMQVNQRAEQLLRVERGSLYGKRFVELFGLEQGWEQRVRDGFDNQYLSVKRHNREIGLSVTATPTKTGEYVVQFEQSETLHKRINRIIGSEANFVFDNIIGESEAIRSTIKMARIAAESNMNVLLTGESGTGKEMFAQAIHNASSRRDGPFVAINCGALPRSLVESELFGYEQGSFTGAKKEGHAGKFELANGGTIFLDEIGDMPLDVQVNLLRVLQTREVNRIGSKKPVKIDVRVVSATNKDLLAAIEEGAFRSDLYYRLNVFDVYIPALRERPEDIRLLTEYFFEKYADGRTQAKLDDATIRMLSQYPWPGNVRELENAVERAAYLAASGLPVGECFHLEQPHRAAQEPQKPAEPGFADSEKERLEKALVASGGNVKRAAELLNISRRTIYRKMEKYGLSRDCVLGFR